MNHINYLICVYKFCKNVKFTKLKLHENFPVYGIYGDIFVKVISIMVCDPCISEFISPMDVSSLIHGSQIMV